MFVTVTALKHALLVSQWSYGHFLKVILLELHDKFSPFNSTHCIVLYPQNGDRIVTIDSVTSLYPMYINTLRRAMCDVLFLFLSFCECQFCWLQPIATVQWVYLDLRSLRTLIWSHTQPSACCCDYRNHRNRFGTHFGAQCGDAAITRNTRIQILLVNVVEIVVNRLSAVVVMYWW